MNTVFSASDAALFGADAGSSWDAAASTSAAPASKSIWGGGLGLYQEVQPLSSWGAPPPKPKQAAPLTATCLKGWTRQTAPSQSSCEYSAASSDSDGGSAGGQEQQQRVPQPVQPQGQTQRGVVKKWNVEKGFGFLQPVAGGEDVFVHHAVINAQGFRSLAEGSEVEYEAIEVAPGRKKAVSVTPKQTNQMVTVAPTPARPAVVAPPCFVQPQQQPQPQPQPQQVQVQVQQQQQQQPQQPQQQTQTQTQPQQPQQQQQQPMATYLMNNNSNNAAQHPGAPRYAIIAPVGTTPLQMQQQVQQFALQQPQQGRHALNEIPLVFQN